jgi:hypothetical protein
VAFKMSRVASGQTGSTAAVVLSPLLNLAFTPGTGTEAEPDPAALPPWKLEHLRNGHALSVA